MSPPLAVTEDTPPDMLAGAMDLLVVLPNGHNVKMSVERSTPMMDLLVQITTTNKISPGSHAIRAYGDRGLLPYQPSTPIGALDAWSVHIVPKKCAIGAHAKKQMPFKAVNHNTPFEQTFRLQVNLPRNQLYVSRVSYNTRLEQVFRQVCDEKNLDPSKYCFMHPEKLDEELNLNSTFHECKLQKVTLMLKSKRFPVEVSSVDIMALKRLDRANQLPEEKYYASHSYDGSVSSGSLEGRSLSPVRSDESSVSPTTSQTNPTTNKPFRKRRPAPKPPSAQNESDNRESCEMLTVLHSRNSSDSSGYHESSVLSESPGSNNNCLAESLPRRSKLPVCVDSDGVRQRQLSSDAKCSKVCNSLSRSLSNLATDVDDERRKCSRYFPSNGMKPKQFSASSTSLTTISGKRKKAPAPPPPLSSVKSLLSLQEEDGSNPCSSSAAEFANDENTRNDVDDVDSRDTASPAKCSSPTVDDSCSRCETRTLNVVTSQSVSTDHLPGNVDLEIASSFDELPRVHPPFERNRNDSGDCTLRRRKKLRASYVSVVMPPQLPQPATSRPPPSPRSPKAHERRPETPNSFATTNIRDRLVNEICNFRFKSKAYDRPSGPSSVESAVRMPIFLSNETSYVRRRKSEIEARLLGADVSVVDRKFSEGSLTFSKIPSSFLFPEDSRHVVFDSRNLEKRYSTGNAACGDVNACRSIACSLAVIDTVKNDSLVGVVDGVYPASIERSPSGGTKMRPAETELSFDARIADCISEHSVHYDVDPNAPTPSSSSNFTARVTSLPDCESIDSSLSCHSDDSSTISAVTLEADETWKRSRRSSAASLVDKTFDFLS